MEVEALRTSLLNWLLLWKLLGKSSLKIQSNIDNISLLLMMEGNEWQDTRPLYKPFFFREQIYIGSLSWFISKINHATGKGSVEFSQNAQLQFYLCPYNTLYHMAFTTWMCGFPQSHAFKSEINNVHTWTNQSSHNKYIIHVPNFNQKSSIEKLVSKSSITCPKLPSEWKHYESNHIAFIKLKHIFKLCDQSIIPSILHTINQLNKSISTS